MLRCVSTTPFGTPVLPLEKMMAATGSSPPPGTNSRPRIHAGRTYAATSIHTFDIVAICAMMSSRYTIPGTGSMPAFDRNSRDVRIVLMRHCSIADAIVSGPAVKFRFTATLPASDTPMFASAPPTDAGSSRPILGSCGNRRRTQRESSSDATSARPNVSRLPVESAMQNDHHWCLAVRTNWRPSSSSACRRSRATCAPSSMIASRAAAAVVVGGSGAPKATVTG